jgi:hypothetical protein
MIIEETRLWRAVLQQAYDDAEVAESLELDWEPELRVQARAFLRADTADDAALLKRVCDLADVPADRVYRWARQRYPLAVQGPDSCPVTHAPCDEGNGEDPADAAPSLGDQQPQPEGVSYPILSHAIQAADHESPRDGIQSLVANHQSLFFTGHDPTSTDNTNAEHQITPAERPRP